MVNNTVFRRVSKRSLRAVLASVASIGLTSMGAFAQQVAPAIPVGAPVPEFSLSDIPLAEGEKIISSDAGPGGSTIYFGGTQYTTIDPSAVPTVASGLNHHPSAGLGGSCASGGCGSSSCRSGLCNTPGCKNGKYGPGVDLGGRPRLGAGGNVCGPTCNPYSYGSVDALYLKHNDLNSFGSPAPFNLGDFDYELGVRVTVGTVPDCHSGFEASFIGPFSWSSTSSRNTGGINSFLTPGNPIVAAQLTSFIDADVAVQRYKADYMSFDLNRTLIGWDVVKLLYGFKYIQYEEDFRYFADGPGPVGVGVLGSSTDNYMVGGQVGIDMIYPVTCRLWSEFRGRGGVFANFAENRFQLSNDGSGTPEIFNEADKTKLAGMIELSGGMRYYLTNNFHIRGGGEMIYLTEVATALNQFDTVMAPSTGRNINVGDSIFLFGFSVGAELKF
jgi:hypothetical protein